MEVEKIKQIIESILFSTGREVTIKELSSCLEISEQEVINSVENLRLEYEEGQRGIEIIKVNNSYQMCSRKDNYEYICQIIDKRNKPNLSQAALETLAIIAYNSKITRAEIEMIRGVNSDGTIYKLLDYNLIEEAGRLDAPGRPTTYKTTSNFLKLFGYISLDELPELPKYKMDENRQIVIDDIIEENSEEAKEIHEEDPIPEMEEKEDNNE